MRRAVRQRTCCRGSRMRHDGQQRRCASRLSCKSSSTGAHVTVTFWLPHAWPCLPASLMQVETRPRAGRPAGARTTPMASSERLRLVWMVLARLLAWSAMGWRSNDTAPTWRQTRPCLRQREQRRCAPGPDAAHSKHLEGFCLNVCPHTSCQGQPCLKRTIGPGHFARYANITREVTWMPMDLRCMVFCSSRTRPDAASSALDGTQPRFTHVPPMSCPSMMATFRPCARARARLFYEPAGTRLLPVQVAQPQHSQGALRRSPSSTPAEQVAAEGARSSACLHGAPSRPGSAKQASELHANAALGGVCPRQSGSLAR